MISITVYVALQLRISRSSCNVQVNIAHKNLLNVVTKLSRMNVGHKNSSLTPKSAKVASSDE